MIALIIAIIAMYISGFFVTGALIGYAIHLFDQHIGKMMIISVFWPVVGLIIGALYVWQLIFPKKR